MSDNTEHPHEFSPADLKYLQLLADRIAADSEWYGARLVVEVWDRADSQPVAWIEHHSEEEDAPTTRFWLGGEPGGA